MKKLLLAVLTCCAALALTACGQKKFKVGFICLHDQTSTYDKNFIDAAKDVCKEKNVEIVLKTGIVEDSACYDTAKDLVNQGCKAIFADSFGHETFMIQAAKEFPEVEFCHATGTQAHTAKLDNFHDAFASIYEGRYIAGIAAGMKVQEMIDNKTITADQAIMGYVGAFPYAEVVSGYTSFYLGAKSVCPDIKMSVRYTSSWYDEKGEADAATALIEQDHAVLISQHADSQGAPGVCETKKVPNVFYNGENSSLSTYLCASRINWRPYFRYMIDCVDKGEKIATDWVGTIANGAVEVMSLNDKYAAKGTKEKMDAAKDAFKAGTLHVFDTNTFTVKGAKITTYLADVDDFGDYAGETEVIKDGYFHESEYRSAPYFDLRIDGITEVQ